MLCDKKVPVQLKVKIYQTLIKPVMLYYSAERSSMRKKEENLLNKTEMGMLRLAPISLQDHTRIEEIRKRAKVRPSVAHVTKRRLSWYRHGSHTANTYRHCRYHNNDARQGYRAYLEGDPEAAPPPASDEWTISGEI